MRAARFSSNRSARTMASIASATGTARGTTEGSWRPSTRIVRGSMLISIVSCSRATEEVGLIANRTTISSPDEMPPRVPPALLLRVRTRPFVQRPHLDDTAQTVVALFDGQDGLGHGLGGNRIGAADEIPFDFVAIERLHLDTADLPGEAVDLDPDGGQDL